MQQIQQSPPGQQSQDQITGIQQQIGQARQQLQQNPQAVSQTMLQLAGNVEQLQAFQQQAQSPAAADKATVAIVQKLAVLLRDVERNILKFR